MNSPNDPDILIFLGQNGQALSYLLHEKIRQLASPHTMTLDEIIIKYDIHLTTIGSRLQIGRVRDIRTGS
ncbi:MAG: hypothetical protein KDD43_11780 [Bdellovibrionales bacterium]|nr:hypothetical protein [Bdellovibrionales bacterium]